MNARSLKHVAKDIVWESVSKVARWPTWPQVWMACKSLDAFNDLARGSYSWKELKQDAKAGFPAELDQLKRDVGRRCWRGIDIENDDKPEEPLGVSWSTDKSIAKEFGSTVLEGRIDADQIDLAATIASRLNPEAGAGEHEHEVRFKDNGRIWVFGVHRVDGSIEPVNRWMRV